MSVLVIRTTRVQSHRLEVSSLTVRQKRGSRRPVASFRLKAEATKSFFSEHALKAEATRTIDLPRSEGASHEVSVDGLRASSSLPRAQRREAGNRAQRFLAAATSGQIRSFERLGEQALERRCRIGASDMQSDHAPAVALEGLVISQRLRAFQYRKRIP